MCTPSHCLPVGRTSFWNQWFSVGPCGFLGNMCKQPLITLSFITLLAVTGTSGQTEPARPLGLLPLPTLFNITFIMKMFLSLPWQLRLGGSAGIFAEWSGTGQGAATALLLHSSGRGQHETLSLQAAPEGRRGRSCSRLALEQLLSAQEPSLGSASSTRSQRALGAVTHTYSLNLFIHSYTCRFSRQHCFSTYSILLFFLVFSYPISYICREQ